MCAAPHAFAMRIENKRRNIFKIMFSHNARKTPMQTLNEAVEVADHEMALSLKSDDFKEGVKSYAEKRVGNFKGR